MEQQPFNSPPPIPPSYQPPNQPGGPMPPNVSSTKLAAGLTGILLSGLGVHKFILGYTKEGINYYCRYDFNLWLFQYCAFY